MMSGLAPPGMMWGYTQPATEQQQLLQSGPTTLLLPCWMWLEYYMQRLMLMISQRWLQRWLHCRSLQQHWMQMKTGCAVASCPSPSPWLLSSRTMRGWRA